MARYMMGCACLSLLVCVSAATAQQRQPGGQPGVQQPGQQPGVQQPGQQPGAQQPGIRQPGVRQPGADQGTVQRGRAATGDSESLENIVASCLILGNQEEIALLQLGAERAKHEDVKQLAKQMIEDHQKFVQKLERFSTYQADDLVVTTEEGGARTAGFRGVDEQADDRAAQPGESARGDRDAQERREARQERQERREARQDGAPRRNLDGRVAARDESLTRQLIKLEKEASQECLRMTKEALKEHEGAAFDKAFVSQQIGAHIAMLSKLKAAENAVSGELRQVISDGQETTKAHKQKLTQLKDKLFDDRDED